MPSSTPLPTLSDFDITDKRVLCRVDLNVPITKGIISDDTRIQAIIPTLNHLRKGGAKVILASHLGRPKGRRTASLSLRPIAKHLSTLIDAPVVFTEVSTGIGASAAIAALPPGGVLLLENLRFHRNEKNNDEKFVQELSELADCFVNDAFGVLHRDHASVVGLPSKMPAAVGLLVEKELAALHALREEPKKPFSVILGGAKVSDKISMIETFSSRADHIFIGGAMAYTILKAKGIEVGASRVEDGQIELAQTLIELCEARGATLHLPVDHIVADSFSETAEALTVAEIGDGQLGLDIGPKTIKEWTKVLKKSKTVLWNGPLGVFEWENFSGGTRSIAQLLAKSKAHTVVGGGDSAAAVKAIGIGDKFNHISTGGGASLEYLSTGLLPGLSAMEKQDE
jgi:phosphoglycerate kinase